MQRGGYGSGNTIPYNHDVIYTWMFPHIFISLFLNTLSMDSQSQNMFLQIYFQYLSDDIWRSYLSRIPECSPQGWESIQKHTKLLGSKG